MDAHPNLPDGGPPILARARQIPPIVAPRQVPHLVVVFEDVGGERREACSTAFVVGVEGERCSWVVIKA